MNKIQIYGYFIVAIFFALFSCETNHELEYHERQEVFPIDSLDVKLPNNYIELNKWGYFYENQDIFLYEYSADKNFDLVINILDFQNGKYEESLLFNREGPNGFKSKGVNVTIVNRDSIFVFPMASDRFYLYSYAGQIIDEFPYNSSDGSALNGSGVFTDIVIQEDRIILPTVSQTRYDDPSFFKKVIPVQYYSLKSKQFEESIPYPSYMDRKFLWSNLASAKINKMSDSTLVIDFRFSDSVRIYNSNTKHVDLIFMGLNNQQIILDELPSKNQEMKYLLTEKEYMFTLYHNQNIYRITSHLNSVKQKAIPLADLMQNYSREMTVIKYNLISKENNYYKMPTARYFLPIKEKLIVGGITSWEDENQDTWRRFYIYKLN